MSEDLSYLLSGAALLPAGAFILYKLEAIVRVDQDSERKFESWYRKKFGRGSWNPALSSPGTSTAERNSRITFLAAGAFCMVFGLGLIALFLRAHFLTW